MDNSSLNNPPKPYLKESYINGINWYRIYSDGWCEQGGLGTSNGSTINLIKAYNNTSYDVLATPTGGIGTRSFGAICTNTKTGTNFKIQESTFSGDNWWVAYGYIS